MRVLMAVTRATRRKEVALKTFCALLVSITVLAGGRAVPAETPPPAPGPDAVPTASDQNQEAASASQASSSSPTSTPSPSAAPPAPPRAYLTSGINLFNSRRYDLAWKYLIAADRYRERLSANEQIVLDVYREKLDEYYRRKHSPAPVASAGGTGGRVAPATDDQVVPAASVTAADTPGRPEVAAMPSLEARFNPLPLDAKPGTMGAGDSRPAPAPPIPPAGLVRGTADTKQRARWLLQQAREEILRKNFDAAEQILAEAQAMDVKWGLFDESPSRVAEALRKARAGGGPLASKSSRDRRTARARLREARAALAAGNLDKAEGIAMDVSSWGVRYGLFEDTPDKLGAAVVEARRKLAIGNPETMTGKPLAGSTARSDGTRANTSPLDLPPLPANAGH
jgi:hypothetical protein